MSNFLTLLIMIVIMLAIYKSCSKNRDMDPRLDFNTTYAQVIHGTDSAPITGVYPPPPPPYVFNCSLLNPNAINPVSLQQRNYNSTVKPDFILNQEILNNNSVISVANSEENSRYSRLLQKKGNFYFNYFIFPQAALLFGMIT